MPRRSLPRAPMEALLLPIGNRDDGSPIMIPDRVAESLRLGASLTDCAARAGVSSESLKQWIRNGNRILAATERGALGGQRTELEQAEVDLARTVESSLAEGKVFLLGLLERVSRGVEVRTTVIRTDAAGNEIERTERIEQKPPDAATIRWRLERRFPDEWAPRTRVELTGEGGGPIGLDVNDRAAELAEALRAAMAAAQAPTNGSGNGRAALPPVGG